ncbi:unnamed protein product [Brassica oleracea]
MGNGSLFFADLKLAGVLSPWSSISGNSFEHHVTLMEATVECSLGQSPVEAIVCVEKSRFLLTGYVNLEPLQTAIVGISDFSNSCMNGKMDLGHLTVVMDGNRFFRSSSSFLHYHQE